MKAVFTAKVLGWICSPLTYSGYHRACIGIGLKKKSNVLISLQQVILEFGIRHLFIALLT